MDILTDLNEQQKKAVTHDGGPVLVLAGAGSGKTRTLTFRAAWLISERGVLPDEVLLLTFTNKAAEEMLNRVQYLVGMKVGFGGTFHSFCARLLRRSGHLIGLEHNFVIYDQDDQETVVKGILSNMKVDIKRHKPGSVLGAISSAKSELWGPDEYAEIVARSSWQEVVAQVYQEYQQNLRNADALDFDDLLFEAVRLLREDTRTREFYQDKIKHVLVDEYQDTNKAQYVLTKLLAGKWRNLMAVGDFSQSIYSWRGADFRNLQNLKKDYPDLEVINLEQNYRSTRVILSGANEVIKKNSSHPVLNLWTDKGEGEKIGLYPARNELEEARFVIENIKYQMSNIKNNSRSFSDFAVLYRTNAQSRTIEEAMLHAGIPYVLVGGTRFYQRREVKDVLAYLRLVANPKDTVSEERVKKLGKGRWALFEEWVEKYRGTETHPTINLNDGRSNLQSPSSTGSGQVSREGIKNTLEIMDRVLEATGYLNRYDVEDEEDLARLDNIKELRSVAERFPALDQFLENVALVEQETVRELEEGKENKVTLMTFHAAKGLEFPIVYMVGMEEGLFPHSRSQLDVTQMEEERRLCYVGMTRAMEELYLTFAARRIYFGRTSNFAVSRFISEIPEELVRSLGYGDYPVMGRAGEYEDIPF